jgi:hypothetical protein
MPAIRTNEAVIRTATIEIKTLSVSKRQVTMGLFRQLQQEELIDPETMEFRGVPWGRVNYFWNGSGGSEGDLHIVWQKDTELRRAVVTKHLPYHLRTSYDRDIRLAEYLSLLPNIERELSALDSLPEGHEHRYHGSPAYNSAVSQAKEAMWNCFGGDKAKEFSEIFYRLGSIRSRTSPADIVKLESGVIECLGKEFVGWVEIENLDYDGALAAAKNELESLTESWQQRYRELEDLDQLFIAV